MNRFWLNTFGLSGMVFLIVFTSTMLFSLPDGRIIAGVKIGPVDVGLRSEAGASRLVMNFTKKVLVEPVSLAFEEKKWSITPLTTGFFLDEDRLVQEAFLVGRTGNWREKLTQRVVARIVGITLPLEWQYDDQLTFSALAAIIEEVEQPPRNARLKITADQVEVVPAQAGLTIDEIELVKKIMAQIGKSNNREVQLPRAVQQPAIATEEIEALGINSLLGKFTTRFNLLAENRVHNIKLAANSMDDYLIPPGAVFSFNEVVGPRTEENGYREAPVIVDNQLTTGLGGGICQASSTLYNGVLLANLPIIERRRHSLQVDYIAVGVDATVVYNYVDLKFQNNTDSHLLIKVTLAEDRLVVRVFGNESFKKQVEVKRLIEEVIPPKEVIKLDDNLIPGDAIVKSAGKPGYRTKVIRIIREKGKIIFEELISQDLYPAEDKVVLVGSGEIN
jgi:vancomycin resistance protein YoaR